MKVEKAPKIVFSGEAYERMMEYARAANGEVAGFGSVERKEGYLYVSETYIMPQRATAGGVMIDNAALHEFMGWCRKSDHPERATKANLWWHSHAAFPVFRSATDNGTVDLLLQVMPYLVCMVVNKRREYELSFHYPTHSFTKMVAHKDDWKGGVRRKCEAEVKEMVSEWKYEPVKQEVVVPGRVMGNFKFEAPFTNSNSRPIADGEQAYLDNLMLGKKLINPETGREESAWQRYEREKEAERDGIESKRVHEMSDEEFKKYCEAYDACGKCGGNDTAGHLTWCDRHVKTKRYIVDEGGMRPNDKDEKGSQR